MYDSCFSRPSFDLPRPVRGAWTAGGSGSRGGGEVSYTIVCMYVCTCIVELEIDGAHQRRWPRSVVARSRWAVLYLPPVESKQPTRERQCWVNRKRTRKEVVVMVARAETSEGQGTRGVSRSMGNRAGSRVRNRRTCLPSPQERNQSSRACLLISFSPSCLPSILSPTSVGTFNIRGTPDNHVCLYIPQTLYSLPWQLGRISKLLYKTRSRRPLHVLQPRP